MGRYKIVLCVCVCVTGQEFFVKNEEGGHSKPPGQTFEESLDSQLHLLGRGGTNRPKWEQNKLL